MHHNNVLLTKILNSYNYEFISRDDIIDVFSLCTELTKDYDESHGIEHHVNVLMNADKILNDELKYIYDNNDYILIVKLTLYATMLHDVLDKKYPKNMDLKKEEVNKFLISKLNDQWINCNWIINNISFSSEKNNGYPIHDSPIVQKARDICFDADKLEAIGEIGLKRCKEYKTATHPNCSSKEIDEIVLHYCRENLIKVPNFLKTTYGKKLAVPLHAVIQEFVEKYNKQ